jgi:O-antigen ligase
MWARWWWHPNQAHNGYIETYLNLGWVGVAILVAVLVATFRKSRHELLRDLDLGRLRFGFLFVIIAYNYTEAAFKGVHLVWTMFHLVAIDYSARHALTPAARPAVAAATVPALEPAAAALLPSRHPRVPPRPSARGATTLPRLTPPSGTRSWKWR